MSERESAEGFWAALRHAFTVPADKPLTDQERRWLEQIAAKVVARRLTTPALMLLESVQPLNYVGAHAVLFFKPIISLLFPPQRCDEVSQLLLKRSALKSLAKIIERRDAEGRARGEQARG